MLAAFGLRKRGVTPTFELPRDGNLRGVVAIDGSSLDGHQKPFLQRLGGISVRTELLQQGFLVLRRAVGILLAVCALRHLINGCQAFCPEALRVLIGICNKGINAGTNSSSFGAGEMLIGRNNALGKRVDRPNLLRVEKLGDPDRQARSPRRALRP